MARFWASAGLSSRLLKVSSSHWGMVVLHLAAKFFMPLKSWIGSRPGQMGVVMPVFWT